MWNEVDQAIGIAFDEKIKPPPTIHTCLPHICSFVVFFCSKRGVSEILQQESLLFLERFLNK